jgi:hypothetical protein
VPVLNSQGCGDAFTDAASITEVHPTPNAGGWFALENNGNEADVQLAYASEYGGDIWTQSQHLGVGAYGTIPTNATGIRFKNHVAGKQAVVDAFLGFKNEPALGIASLGTINVSGASINLYHNGTLVAVEPGIDIVDPANVFTFTAVDTPGTKVAFTPVISSPAIFPGAVSTGPTTLVPASVLGVIIQQGEGQVGIYSSASTINALALSVDTDTTTRFIIQASGALNWGPGNAARDTTLSRTAVGVLTLSTGTVISVGTITNSSLANAGALITSGGGFQGVLSSVATSMALGVVADTSYRFLLQSDGKQLFGPGNATQDVTLARFVLGSTGILAVSGSTAANGSLRTDGNVFWGFVTTALAATATYATNALICVNSITQATGGGTLTMSNPTNPPTSAAHSGFLIYIFSAAVLAGTTFAWGSQFIGSSGYPLPASLAAASGITTIIFVADYTSGSIQWRRCA